MTEYDYSPEAVNAFFRKQQKISHWVDNTLDHRRELRNPFTPATPAVDYVQDLQPTDDSDDESDRPRRHRRRESKDDRRDRRREKERDRELDKEWVRVEREREKVKDRHVSRRHRSSSVDVSTARPMYKQPPPPLPIPPYPVYPNYPQQRYPPKLTSPRDSHHSSRTSATLLQPSPTYLPYTAPVYTSYQSYPYPQDSYSSSPYYRSSGYSSNVPQYRYAAYETKPPLLKRLFMTLKGNKQHQQLQQPVLHPPPHQRDLGRRKRSTSF